MQRSSVTNIEKWRAEIREVEQEVPIVLIITKKDLRLIRPDETVSTDEFKEVKKRFNLTAMHETSSKDWEDFNVHKAFQKAIKTALDVKYGCDDSEDD